MACNRATADLMISSPLMHEPYMREVPDYNAYRQRPIELKIDEELMPTPL
jgi:methylglyoxal synthase